jgi:molybdopterin biosynthesis enzyme
MDAGEALPDGVDAVAALDTVQVQGAEARALTPVAPGEGVLPPDADAQAGLKLILTGTRLRRIDVAVLTALGIGRLPIREPRVRVVRAGAGNIVDGAATLIARAIDAESGMAVTDGVTLEQALAMEDADALVAIGGTGSGRNDRSVKALARAGKVAFHGIAIAPGETTALGFVAHRPVLLLPGRMDAALAGWVTVGRRMLARLAFRLVEEQPFSAELARKIASPLGLAEVVPVRRRLSKVEPVATGYLPLQALARAEGWLLVPADSEGHPAGARVVVRPWP